MNKKEAQKVAADVAKNGHKWAIRHYGRGDWAVEIEGGKVIQSVEGYENWKIDMAYYAAQAESDKAMYGYAEGEATSNPRTHPQPASRESRGKPHRGAA